MEFRCKRSFKSEAGGILFWRSHCALLGWPQATSGNSSEAAMAISAMHLVYLDSNHSKQRGKNPHHTQGQTQAESKSSAPKRTSNRIQCKACPAAALQSQQCLESNAPGWEVERGSEHGPRLEDADGSQRRGGSEPLTQTWGTQYVWDLAVWALQACSWNVPPPCPETFHEPKARTALQGGLPSPQHTHNSPTHTSSPKHLALKRISSWPVIFSLSKGSCRLINLLVKESGGVLTTAFQLQAFKPAHVVPKKLNYECSLPCSDLVPSFSARGNRGDSGRATSTLQKWDMLMKILTELDTTTECCKENLHNVTLTVQ